MKNGNVLIAQRRSISQTEVLTKWKNFFGVSRETRRNRKWGKLIGGNVYVEERSKSLEEWGNYADYNFENPVGDYGRVGNHALEEENDRITI